MPFLLRPKGKIAKPLAQMYKTHDAREKRIMAVHADNLFGKYRGRYFEGFVPATSRDFHKIVMENFTWIARGNAETNFSFKQPIPYVLIYNPDTGKFFTYSRAPKSGEARLAGKKSLGIGGHVEPRDASIAAQGAIFTAMLRELREEVTCNYENVRMLGFINTDEDDVGKVHFGYCYLLETSSDVEIADPHLEGGKMFSLEEIGSEYDGLETWSKIAFEHVRKIIG